MGRINGIGTPVVAGVTKAYVDGFQGGTTPEELQLRKDCPAVKEAWERYQVILKLALEKK